MSLPDKYPPLACQGISRISLSLLRGLTLNTVAVTPEAQVSVDPKTPQEPLEDAKVNPDPGSIFVRGLELEIT